MGLDLEAFRELLKNDDLHIAVGKITKTMLASDRSALRVMVSIFPENREILARMTWDAVGSEAGFFVFPSVNDLVLVCMAEGDDDQAFVFARLTSREDKIPLNAANGDMVAKALAGKKIWITSDQRVNISAGDSEPTENLVLGQVFKTLMSSFLQYVSVHKHIGNLGYYTAPPDNASDYTALKASPVDNEDVLSDISFTEKG